MRNRTFSWTYLGWVFWLLAVSACTRSDLPFNQCGCEVSIEDKGALVFESEGEEEQLQPWMDGLARRLGRPEITFLHFRLETYAAFFDPSKWAFATDRLNSPYGIQKILVWDRPRTPAWWPDSLQLSVQIREHRMGKRPIDPYACRVEVRLRNRAGRDLLRSCENAEAITAALQDWTEPYLGMPHDTTPDPEFPEKVHNYEGRKAAYTLRVKDFLNPKCYPTVQHWPGGNFFRLQVCEHDGMQDTLRARVRVLSAAGDSLPYLLYDYINDTLPGEIYILDGILGYEIHFRNIREVEEIWFDFRDGRKMKYYEKGDYTRHPLPYKPRYSPEDIKKWREKKLNEELRPPEKVMS
ncbi:MAG: hypothetical protein AAGN35_09040 [Bacteroidota bacterium]